MAMRHPKSIVLSGALSALVVMTVLSTGLGRIVPNLISRKHTNSAATVLYLFIGLRLLYIPWRSDSKSNQKKEMEEFCEARKQLESMRDRMERLVLFPFEVGCMSESSVGIASQHPRRSSSSGHSPPPLPPKGGHEEADDQTLSDDDQCSKSSWTLPKPNLSVGMNRLFKGFKNFSHLFVYKEDEEEEMEIEIGVPTDVKHVSHIGWDDGATNYSIIKLEGNWDHDNHQKLQLLAAKFNHHHQLDDDPSSSTATADPAPIVPDHHDDLNIYIADHDQDSGEIGSIGRYSRSIIKMHGHH